MTEGEPVGWHHRLSGPEFAQALGDGDGQGSLACCSPWGRKEWDMTEQLKTISGCSLEWYTSQSTQFYRVLVTQCEEAEIRYI